MLFLIVLAWICGIVTSSSELTWHLQSTRMFRPPSRSSGILVYDAPRSRLLMFGGRSPAGGCFSDTWELLMRSATWEWRQISSGVTPFARSDFVGGIVSFGTDGYFIVATGSKTDGTPIDDAWALKLSTNNGTTSEGWFPIITSGETPKARSGAVGGIAFNSTKLIVSQGVGSRQYADTFQLDLSQLKLGVKTAKWKELKKGAREYAPYSPHPRYSAAGTITKNGKLAFYGGCLSGKGTGGPCPSNDGWILDSESTWTRADNGPAASSLSSMIYLQESDKILLYGGSATSSQVITTKGISDNEINVLDPKDGTWTRYITNGDIIPKLRRKTMMASVPINGSDVVVMWGGENNAKGMSDSEVFVLSGSLATTSTSNKSKPWFTFWMLHGLFMVLGWAVFSQAETIIRRYFVYKGGARWQTSLRVVWTFSLIFICVGFALGIVSSNTKGASHFSIPHSAIGLVVMILLIFKLVFSYLQRFFDGRWNVIYSFVQNAVKVVEFILTMSNISIGLFMGLSLKYVWILWYIYLGLLVAGYGVLEIIKLKRKRDTRSKDRETSTQTSDIPRKLSTELSAYWEMNEKATL